jgi:S-adenosylmethionine decarboxylase
MDLTDRKPILSTVATVVPSSTVFTDEPMPDLAPMIHRQRLVVEGRCSRPITAGQICAYLSELSEVTGMITLIEPVTHRSPLYGWAGWIHWETSGAHFYAWEQPLLFFSVDVYTCKAFDPDAVVEFTQRYFDAHQIVAKGF